MKYMKWRDLKPGDKLRLNAYFLSEFQTDNRFDILYKWKDNIFEVLSISDTDIDYYKGCNTLYFRSIGDISIPSVTINYNTGELFDFNGPPVFEIVELTGD